NSCREVRFKTGNSIFGKFGKSRAKSVARRTHCLRIWNGFSIDPQEYNPLRCCRGNMLRCPHDPRCASRRSRGVRGMPTEIIGSLTRRVPVAADRSRHQFWLACNVGGGDGDTIISLRHRTQRALVPTISQAGSPDTMSRRHFGQVYRSTVAAKSYWGPTEAHIM